MRRAVATAAVAVAGAIALALPGAASAGGFATVGLSSLPDGTAPGRPWHVTLTILRHGRTPLSTLRPTITIRSGDIARTFPARPALRRGTYTADVVFPTAGRWRYEVNDNFSQIHTFAPVSIGASHAVTAPPPAPASSAAAAADDGGADVGAALAVALAAGLLAALATALVLHRRPPAVPAAQ
jgi:hypothetical protein